MGFLTTLATIATYGLGVTSLQEEVVQNAMTNIGSQQLQEDTPQHQHIGLIVPKQSDTALIDTSSKGVKEMQALVEAAQSVIRAQTAASGVIQDSAKAVQMPDGRVPIRKLDAMQDTQSVRDRQAETQQATQPALVPGFVPALIPAPALRPALVPAIVPGRRPGLVPVPYYCFPVCFAPAYVPAPGSSPALVPRFVPAPGSSPALVPVLIPALVPALVPAVSPTVEATQTIEDVSDGYCGGGSVITLEAHTLTELKQKVEELISCRFPRTGAPGEWLYQTVNDPAFLDEICQSIDTIERRGVIASIPTFRITLRVLADPDQIIIDGYRLVRVARGVCVSGICECKRG